MPVTYTNRKGVIYYLRQTVTKTGKLRYIFAREPKGGLVEQITESVNGVVSLVWDRRPQILPEEVTAVEAEVERHLKSHRCRVVVKWP